jgi:20S proteasome subunit beta 1
MLERIAEQFARHQHRDEAEAEQQDDDGLFDVMRYMGYVTAADGGKEVSTGTTIMACEFDGGVIMAADSRTSTGDYVANRTSRKIFRLTEKIFVLRSGSAADTQALTAMVRNYLNQHSISIGAPPTVNTAANLMRLIAYNNKDNLTAGLIVGGWDAKRGPQVYVIPLGGTKLHKKVAIGGSGSGYITGLVDHLFKPNMSKRECQAMVAKCVSHAMARDGSSGGLIRMVTITADEVTEDCIYGDQLPFKLGQEAGSE